MTPEQLTELERKREEREDELILLLLLLFGYSVQNTDEGRPLATVRGLLRTTGVNEIAGSMADVHLDAFGVYTNGVGVPTDTRPDLIRQYTPIAREAADAMVSTISEALDNPKQPKPADMDGKLPGEPTLPKYAPGLNTAQVALQAALLQVGYSKSNSTGIELGAERNIVTASNAGLFGGAVSSVGVNKITGFRHRSVIDDRTTKICDERDSLSLPIDDPYWQEGGWPSLHWKCRSVIDILTTAFKPSGWRPRTPPDIGFGRMPAVVLAMVNSRRR